MPIHAAPTMDEVQALRDRVAFLHELLKQYRKVTRAQFIEEIVPDKIDRIVAGLEEKRKGWEAITEAVLERHAELNDWECDILDKPPRFQEAVAKRWVNEAEDLVLWKCQTYLKQIFKFCEKLDKEGTEAARNSDAARIWLKGTLEDLKPAVEELKRMTKQEVLEK
ncbi:hypothetical protein FB567DRAFT_457626 [Paraphoma chrysanthemicola]|uniref:Uncharacterized protein n=1 Tax=Paraphoma chrysanthemicola TaxID=798071 RepID=A0A8K0QSB3_9PLEO|nr:hypothetical protein FB567DRAFT_457626 [Paraphoma chrysanthemicola]